MISPFIANQDVYKEEADSNKTENTKKLQTCVLKEQSGRVLLQDLINTSTRQSPQEADHLNRSKYPDLECTHFDQLSSQNSVPPFQASWRTVTRLPRTHFTPDMSLLSKRGSYVLRLSPSCSLGVLAVNCDQVTDIEVVFFSPLADAELGVHVYSSKANGLTGRYIYTFILLHYAIVTYSIVNFYCMYNHINNYTFLNIKNKPYTLESVI